MSLLFYAACHAVVIGFPEDPGVRVTEGDADTDTDADADTDTACTSSWWRDADGDLYGDPDDEVTGCTAPEGYVSNANDCDDGSALSHPGEPEVCDGLDNDCDGQTDESGGATWYADADGDGYGDAGSPSTSCDAPDGDVADATDCDDADASVHPGATEAWDLGDADCDGEADEADAATLAGWTIVGDAAGDALGDGGVALSADLDGDGEAELILGVPLHGSISAGLVAVHDRGDRGLDVPLSAGWLVLEGDASDDRFGQSVISAGDPDGDGDEDVAVGAWLHNAEERDAGAVYLFDGEAVGGPAGDVATALLVGEAEDGGAGWTLASGDLDGDGLGDLAVGAPGEEEGAGRVWVLLGADAWWRATSVEASDVGFDGEDGGDALGYALTVAPDFQGDGYGDLVACAPGWDDAGACWVVAGRAEFTSEEDLGDAAFARVAGESGDALASAPTSLATGDGDGDGRSDLGIGAPGRDAAGVFFGASLGGDTVFTEASLLLAGGETVAFADLDGDGLAEIVTGVADAANVASGVDGEPRATLSGSAGESLGSALAGDRDLDGDGRADLAIGAASNDSTGSNAGKIYILTP